MSPQADWMPGPMPPFADKNAYGGQCMLKK